MRPDILNPLFVPMDALPGVGPRLAKLYERLAGVKAVGLLWHLPTGLIDRRYAPKIRDAQEGRVATLILWIDGHQPSSNPRLPYRVRCRDETGFMHLVYFHARADYLEKLLPVGEQRVVSGRLERFRGELQITHPDHVGTLAELESMKGV
ncbi:MAG: OB-fold nucleic acid binding domain-containing protein, partial [Alphaproteobacteria bacterium]